MMSRFIHYVHWAFLLFTLTAWALPWRDALWIHLFLVAGLILHWKTNNDRCILTELEQKFKMQENSHGTSTEIAVDEGQFVRRAWSQVTGQEPSEKVLRATIYAAMALVWSLSALQLFMGFSFFNS